MCECTVGEWRERERRKRKEERRENTQKMFSLMTGDGWDEKEKREGKFTRQDKFVINTQTAQQRKEDSYA